MMRPVLMRYWQQREIWDGTYVVDDLLALMEMMGEAERGASG